MDFVAESSKAIATKLMIAARQESKSVMTAPLSCSLASTRIRSGGESWARRNKKTKYAKVATSHATSAEVAFRQWLGEKMKIVMPMTVAISKWGRTLAA